MPTPPRSFAAASSHLRRQATTDGSSQALPEWSSPVRSPIVFGLKQTFSPWAIAVVCIPR
jgi:hypothetical protein